MKKLTFGKMFKGLKLRGSIGLYTPIPFVSVDIIRNPRPLKSNWWKKTKGWARAFQLG